MVTPHEALKIYVPAADLERIRAIAREEDRTVTGLIRLAISAYLAERDASLAA